MWAPRCADVTERQGARGEGGLPPPPPPPQQQQRREQQAGAHAGEMAAAAGGTINQSSSRRRHYQPKQQQPAALSTNATVAAGAPTSHMAGNLGYVMGSREEVHSWVVSVVMVT